MEPISSLVYSQESSIVSYLEPDQPSAYQHILLESHFNIIHPSVSWYS
jgi:hypothetical protein